MRKKYLIIGIVILLIAGWFIWTWVIKSNNKVNFRVARVERGDIVQTVNATGTIQPLKLVQVGTQVTGPVLKLYADFNSRVKAGDLVAQIDPAIYETRVAEAEAGLTRSQAQVEQVKANLSLAKKELARARELAQRDLISKSELDSAVANVDSLNAQIKLSEAGVQQSKSALQTAQVNLQYTTIKSPVDGVVISRNVDEGQTVVASLSAQTLFVIATDMKKIKVEASISEADIGKISINQPVTFTVDAYADRDFSGEVVQVRLSPTTQQNVVTYVVVIHADNPDEKLFPGMTANLTFEVARRPNVLKIPNAALRFTPDTSLIEETPKDTKDETLADKEKIVTPTNTSERPRGERDYDSRRQRDRDFTRRPDISSKSPKSIRSGQVWIQTDKGLLKSIPVSLGITDGSFSELVKGELLEGQMLVTGLLEKNMTQSMVNPLAPPRMMGPGGRR